MLLIFHAEIFLIFSSFAKFVQHTVMFDFNSVCYCSGNFKQKIVCLVCLMLAIQSYSPAVKQKFWHQYLSFLIEMSSP
jgi:hypothetical protein